MAILVGQNTMQDYYFLSSDDQFSKDKTINYLLEKIQLRAIHQEFDEVRIQNFIKSSEEALTLVASTSKIKLKQKEDSFFFDYDSPTVDFTFTFEQNQDVADGMITLYANQMDSALMIEIKNWLNASPFKKKVPKVEPKPVETPKKVEPDLTIESIPKDRKLTNQEIRSILKTEKWYCWSYPSMQGANTALRYFSDRDEFYRFGLNNDGDRFTHFELIEDLDDFIARTTKLYDYTDYYFKPISELMPLHNAFLSYKDKAEAIKNELKNNRNLFHKWGFEKCDTHLLYLDYIGWYTIMKKNFDSPDTLDETSHFRISDNRATEELMNQLIKYPDDKVTEDVPFHVRLKKNQTLTFFKAIFPDGIQPNTVYFKNEKECFTILENGYVIYITLQLPEKSNLGFKTEEYGWLDEEDVQKIKELTGKDIKFEDFIKMESALKTSMHEHQGVLLEWLDEMEPFLSANHEAGKYIAKTMSIDDLLFQYKGKNLLEIFTTDFILEHYHQKHLRVTCGPFRPGDYITTEEHEFYSPYSQKVYDMRETLDKLFRHDGFVQLQMKD